MRKILISASLIALLGVGCSAATNPQPASPQAASNAAAASVKFADQPYYKYAYLISGPTIDAKAKQALDGFSMTKTPNADGTTQYVLKALKPEYKDQTYAIKPDQQLYFIEMFLGDDDDEKNEDNGMRDDMAVVVNADGTVASGPNLWTK